MSAAANQTGDAARIRLEDALKHLLESDEAGRGATVESLAGAMGWQRPQAAEVIGQLRGRGLAGADGDVHRLTEDGRAYAMRVVRSHRLYETWLARETGTPAVEWHREAHKAEHFMQSADADAMADRLGNPRFDPHGDPIPTREGRLLKRELVSLASWQDGQAACIQHIEDEPESLFRQAESLALAPGTRLDDPRHLADGAVVCRVEGREVTITAAVAALIHVAEPEIGDSPPAGLQRLSAVPVGGVAVVHALAPSCTGAERRRLLDLGVVPGTRIRCEFASPFGSPRSYEIRGALIALRDYQAERILVHPPSSP
jgi:DtxR family Mn-dependent transcriptional regulator